MKYNKYRDLFRKKAKVLFDDCYMDCMRDENILCPLPKRLPIWFIRRHSHVCMRAFSIVDAAIRRGELSKHEVDEVTL